MNTATMTSTETTLVPALRAYGYSRARAIPVALPQAAAGSAGSAESLVTLLKRRLEGLLACLRMLLA